MTTDTSFDARTGAAVEQLPASDAAEVAASLTAARAAAAAVAAAPPAVRAGWLRAVADALQVEDTAARLVAAADRETGLGLPRLTGELARGAHQLRFYADVAVEGSWLAATLDHATATTPDLRRLQVPLGPVAVLGASNFPFGFGVLGNDTGSALAAGCPVLAKAHPAHPVTSRLLGEVASSALAEAGAPPGAFALLSGFEAGSSLVTAPEVAAVAFTGSQHGGLALWRLAQDREVPIPVFAEMGTINPAVMTSAATGRAEEVAAGFVASFTLGMGQFCTKPGLLLVPAGHDLPARLAEALTAAAPEGWLLTSGIASSFAAGVEELVAEGARTLARVPAPEEGWAAAATLLEVPSAGLRAGSRLLEECFGPVALVAEYADRAELDAVLGALQGALAGSVQSGGAEDPEVPGLVAALGERVGRVMVDDWPTGVAFTWAQQHGGPWPATTVASATSVGAGALDRFTRPVAWQSVPGSALPPALRDDNPWGLPRRVDGVLVPTPGAAS
ncbi:MAG: aldehyde dehydrogenase family protein [Nocardioidaceae bacterium]